MIPFGPWRPDVAAFESQYSTEALNVIPSERGFRPFLQPSGTGSGGLSENPKGAISVRDLNGTVYNFCGTTTKLYKLSSTGLLWQDVSRLAGGAYAVATEGKWSFSQFGNVLMADNGVDAAQSFTLGTSANFAALAGSPPIAKHAFIVKNFAVKANIAASNAKVQWCDIENPAAWATGGTSLADSQVLPEGGEVVGGAGGEVGVVFQERSIQRMSFVGMPYIFDFAVVSNTLGCRLTGSIASWGDTVFFLSNEGFYQIVGGSQLTPIGFGKVDRYIERQLDESLRYLCSSAIDPVNKLYIFSYVSVDSDTGEPDTVLFYHWPTGEWSRGEYGHKLIYPGYAQTGYTLDTLDTLSASIDALTVSLDSPSLAGTNRLNLIIFGGGGSMMFTTGYRMAVTIETGEFQLNDGRKTMLRGVRPVVEGQSEIGLGGRTPVFSALPIYRDNLFRPSTTGAISAVNDYGIAPMRCNARYHRIRVNTRNQNGIEGAVDFKWDFMLGIDDISTSAMGKR
jgi:hypothetical protein